MKRLDSSCDIVHLLVAARTKELLEVLAKDSNLAVAEDNERLSATDLIAPMFEVVRQSRCERVDCFHLSCHPLAFLVSLEDLHLKPIVGCGFVVL